MPCAWTAAVHGPRCCTQRRSTGDRLDAGHMASGDAVQVGAPGGAVSVSTVQAKSHLLHGSGIALTGGRIRRQSGAVVRPPGFRSYRGRGRAASARVSERHRHVVSGVIAHWQKDRAALGVWTTAARAPRCCTGSQGPGDLLDAGHRASGDAVQEGAPESAVGVGTVLRKRHPLHGLGITLAGRCQRQQSGAVVRPQGFGFHHEQGHGLLQGWRTAPASCARRHRARSERRDRTAREWLTRRPALRRATHGVGSMPTRGRYGSVARAEGPMPSATINWGFSASRGEMLSQGRNAASMPCGWMAVTQLPSRNRSAPQPVRPVGRSSRLDSQDGRRWNSVACAGSREAASCTFRYAGPKS